MKELKKREHLCVGKMLKIYTSKAINEIRLSFSSGTFA